MSKTKVRKFEDEQTDRYHQDVKQMTMLGVANKPVSELTASEMIATMMVIFCFKGEDYNKVLKASRLEKSEFDRLVKELDEMGHDSKMLLSDNYLEIKERLIKEQG